VKGPPVVIVAALWAAAVVLMVAGMLDEHPSPVSGDGV
jgi:hypothetical protein